MNDDPFRYDTLVADALRGVVRKVLFQTVRNGLTGRHHFYVTFRTDYPGVEIPEYLRQRHPEEMTIVLQHQFWGLEVNDEGFEVTLTFNRVSERLVIPFESITAFADPSAQFLLPFQVDSAKARRTLAKGGPLLRGQEAEDLTRADDGKGADEMPDGPKDEIRPADDAPAARPDAGGGGNVVTLDAFRKK